MLSPKSSTLNQLVYFKFTFYQYITKENNEQFLSIAFLKFKTNKFESTENNNLWSFQKLSRIILKASECWMLNADCHTRKTDTNTSSFIECWARWESKLESFSRKYLVGWKFSQNLSHSTRNWSENREPFSVFYPIFRSGKEVKTKKFFSSSNTKKLFSQ
jgi:hypothetical protein